MKILKEDNGITLVALVITIIVLIILAGITITMVLGEDGLIGKTKKGANEYKNAANNELEMLGNLNELFNEIVNGSGQTDNNVQKTINVGTTNGDNPVEAINCEVGEYFFIQTIYDDIVLSGCDVIETCVGPMLAGVNSKGFLVRTTTSQISGDKFFGYIKLTSSDNTITKVIKDDEVNSIECNVGDYYLIQTIYTEETLTGCQILGTCTGPMYTNNIDSNGYLVKATGTTISCMQNFGYIKIQ